MPNKYEEDPKLAKWVEQQRASFTHGIMDPERKRRLDETCFDFAPGQGRK
jgi:hypothetical protein